MKVLRILMVLVFLLATVAVSPAQAAEGQKVGFIRLLTTLNSKLPVRMQAQAAYTRIKPQLMALQKQGAILAFHPELRAGMVQIQYSLSEASSAALSQYSIFDSAKEAAVRPAGGMRPSPQTGSPEAVSPIFTMELYDGCFGASDLGADAHIIGSLRDKANRITTTYEGYADGNGEILDCFPYWSASYPYLLPGYSVTFKVYDSSEVLQGTFSVVAPDIKFTLLNNAKAVVRGAGTASKNYEVDWYHRDLDAADNLTYVTKAGVTTAAGAWVKDMSTGAFRGGDLLEIYFAENSTFTFIHSMNVPYLHCQLASNYCELYAFPLQAVTLSIKHANVTYPFSGTADAFGYFSAELGTEKDPIFLKASDKITATNLAVYTLPALTGTINFATDVVYGKVKPNHYFDLSVYNVCSCMNYDAYTQSNATGNYSVDFTGDVDLIKTEANNIQIKFTDLTTGNQTDYIRSFGP